MFGLTESPPAVQVSPSSLPDRYTKRKTEPLNDVLEKYIKESQEDQEYRAQTLWDEATGLVNGERAADYGDSTLMLQNIASVWTGLVDVEITPKQVSLMMIGLKLCREANSHKRDNLVDILGYVQIHEKAVKEL